MVDLNLCVQKNVLSSACSGLLHLPCTNLFIFVRSFQELDLSKEAMVFTESQREQEWRRTVALSLHPKCSYKEVR